MKLLSRWGDRFLKQSHSAIFPESSSGLFLKALLFLVVSSLEVGLISNLLNYITFLGNLIYKTLKTYVAIIVYKRFLIHLLRTIFLFSYKIYQSISFWS